MKNIFYLLFLFATIANAQLINLKILDFSNHLPLDDADVYFKHSTKSFISDIDGKIVVDLNNVTETDELIVSKKDYQNAIIKVSDLKTELNIELEKVSKIELKEAFITNLKTDDILKKIIENYDNNFNIDEYYFLVNFQQNLLYNKKDRDFIDTDLQFKFKKGDIKIKSKGYVNNEFKSGREPNSNISLVHYLKSIYLKDQYIKAFLKGINNRNYLESNLSLSKYGEHYVYEIFIKNKSRDYYLTVDKKTFAVVDFSWNTYISDTKISENEILTEAKVVYKYRPHNGNWVLKETSSVWNTKYEKDNTTEFLDMNFSIIVNNYSTQPFPDFNKTVNEKMDIRKSFK